MGVWLVAHAMCGCGVTSGKMPMAPAEGMSFEDSVIVAVDYQMTHYPCSQYRDVYKNFMQDFFGPGHMLNDTAASGRYLRRELEETDAFRGPLYEPTGLRGNFYRVNLSLIKDGIVPYDLYFDTFVSSVRAITPPSGAEWMSIWHRISAVIDSCSLRFPSEEKDRRALEEQFARGDYVVHHSDLYNRTVSFHYRIMERGAFERRILPLLVEHGLVRPSEHPHIKNVK